VTAKAFAASKMEFRYRVFSDPWKRGVPDSVVISRRERPGLENSTEYGSWLILTLFDSGTGNTRPVRFNPIHNQGHAASGDIVLVKQDRECCQVVRI
jgi:hypothetical protein